MDEFFCDFCAFIQNLIFTKILIKNIWKYYNFCSNMFMYWENNINSI